MIYIGYFRSAFARYIHNQNTRARITLNESCARVKVIWQYFQKLAEKFISDYFEVDYFRRNFDQKVVSRYQK